MNRKKRETNYYRMNDNDEAQTALQQGSPSTVLATPQVRRSTQMTSGGMSPTQTANEDRTGAVPFNMADTGRTSAGRDMADDGGESAGGDYDGGCLRSSLHNYDDGNGGQEDDARAGAQDNSHLMASDNFHGNGDTEEQETGAVAGYGEATQGRSLHVNTRDGRNDVVGGDSRAPPSGGDRHLPRRALSDLGGPLGGQRTVARDDNTGFRSDLIGTNGGRRREVASEEANFGGDLRSENGAPSREEVKLMLQVQVLKAQLNKGHENQQRRQIEGRDRQQLSVVVQELIGSKDTTEEAKRIGILGGGEGTARVSTALYEVNKLPRNRRSPVLKKMFRNSPVANAVRFDGAESDSVWSDVVKHVLRQYSSTPHTVVAAELTSGVRWSSVKGESDLAKYRDLKVKINSLYGTHLWLQELGFGDTSLGYTEAVAAQAILRSLPETHRDRILLPLCKVAGQVTTIEEIERHVEFHLRDASTGAYGPSRRQKDAHNQRKRGASGPASGCFTCGGDHLQRNCTESPAKRVQRRETYPMQRGTAFRSPPVAYAFAAGAPAPPARRQPASGHEVGYTYSDFQPPPPDTPPPGNIGGGIAALAEEMACYGCGKPGHRRSECPDVQCFKCQQFGHYAGDCQSPAQARSSGRPVQSGRERPQGQYGRRSSPLKPCPRCTPAAYHTLAQCPSFNGCEGCGLRDHPTGSYLCRNSNQGGRCLNGKP